MIPVYNERATIREIVRRVQAVNIPNGGIDIGVFGYAGDLLNDARGLVKQAVTGGAGTRAATSTRASK